MKANTRLDQVIKPRILAEFNADTALAKDFYNMSLREQTCKREKETHDAAIQIAKELEGDFRLTSSDVLEFIRKYSKGIAGELYKGFSGIYQGKEKAEYRKIHNYNVFEGPRNFLDGNNPKV